MAPRPGRSSRACGGGVGSKRRRACPAEAGPSFRRTTAPWVIRREDRDPAEAASAATDANQSVSAGSSRCVTAATTAAPCSRSTSRQAARYRGTRRRRREAIRRLPRSRPSPWRPTASSGGRVATNQGPSRSHSVAAAHLQIDAADVFADQAQASTWIPMKTNRMAKSVKTPSTSGPISRRRRNRKTPSRAL